MNKPSRLLQLKQDLQDTIQKHQIDRRLGLPPDRLAIYLIDCISGLSSALREESSWKSAKQKK